MGYHVRWMIRRDIKEVLALEQMRPDPASEEDILVLLRQQNIVALAVEDRGQPAEVDEFGMVERGPTVVGMVVYAYSKRSLRVLRLTTAEGSRTEIVEAALRNLLGKLSPSSRTHLYVPVYDTDTELHLILRRLGFLCIRVEHGEGNARDVYHFAYKVRVLVEGRECEGGES